MLKAITRQANAVDAKVRAVNAERAAQTKASITTAYFFDHLATDEDTAVMVTEEDFLGAKAELVPSVSVDELRHYEKVRQTFEGQAKEKEGQGQMTIGQAAAAAAQGGEKVPIGASRLDGGDSGAKGKGKGKEKEKEKGKGKGKGRASAEGDEGIDGEDGDGNEAEHEAGGDEDEDEDEYVIRTDHLKANGSAEKGKGKAMAADGGGEMNGGAAFGEGAEGDEDMYQ